MLSNVSSLISLLILIHINIACVLMQLVFQYSCVCIVLVNVIDFLFFIVLDPCVKSDIVCF